MRVAGVFLHRRTRIPASVARFIAYTINRWTFRSTRRKMRATLTFTESTSRVPWISIGRGLSFSKTPGAITANVDIERTVSLMNGCMFWSLHLEPRACTSSVYAKQTGERFASMPRKSTRRKSQADPENPEWTAEDFRRARPAREVLPEIFGKAMARRLLRPRGRPKSASPRTSISLRVPQDVLARWKATGPGWQTRMVERLYRAK